MAFDYKREFKDLYAPGRKPSIVTVPPMQFVAVCGTGDPNEENGAYAQALQSLYSISYTIKMSKKGSHNIDGYFDYVVPPLEGFWWQDGIKGMDYAHKETFSWISAIRLPDFVTQDEFAWAKEEAERKKKADFSAAEFVTIDEGLCVQYLHVGPYDDEPATVERMHDFATAQGYALNITDSRHHHEIYLGDPRRTAPGRLRTIIRHPIVPIS